MQSQHSSGGINALRSPLSRRRLQALAIAFKKKNFRATGLTRRVPDRRTRRRKATGVHPYSHNLLLGLQKQNQSCSKKGLLWAMNTKKLNGVVCLALAGCVALLAAWPTEAQSNSSVPVQVEPYPCEYNISTLSAAHHTAGDDGLVIVIARLGDGEYTKDLNRRRLHNVRVYLTEFDWHRRPETVITAEGEPVKGYGRIELYVKGNLFRGSCRQTQSGFIGGLLRTSQ